MVTIKDLAALLNYSEEQLRERYPKAYEELTRDSKKFDHATLRKFFHSIGMGFGPKTITIAALKGGIGKTFLSTHVATRASMLGMKVLLIDLDPEACASNSLLSEAVLQSSKKMTIYEILRTSENINKAIVNTKYAGLDIIPSSLRVSKTEKIVNGKNPKTLLKKYIDSLDYDFIFFELPPSFSTLSSAAYLASDTVVIPCTPNIHALESVDLTIEAVTEVATEFECRNMEFKVVMNMFNAKRNASQDVLQILTDDHPKILLPFQIHESADVLNAINAGLTVYETKCSPKIRNELDLLVKNLCTVVPINDMRPRGMTMEYTNRPTTPISTQLATMPKEFGKVPTLTQ